MANKEIDDLALLTAPTGADVYVVKTNTDYRVRVGEANGFATLDVSAKLTASQLPTHTHTFASLTSKPTTRAGYGITDAAASAHTHGAADITSGVVATARLGTGTANSTTYLRGDGTWAGVASGSASWGTISGTLSNQSDLQTALNAKSATSHTHTFASITNKPTTLAGYGITDGGGGGGSSTWGSITGTLSSQTDLQTALNGKQVVGSYAASSHTHTTAQVSGLGTWATKNQTVSTSGPSGTPAAGDTWLQYTP